MSKLMNRPTGKHFPPIPPKTRADGADDIHNHVPWIARCPPQQMRTNHLEEDRPEKRVERDFRPGRRIVGGSQPQPAVHQQEKGQRARYEQHVIEMKPHEGVMNARPDEPTIQSVQRARNQTKTIPNIPEFLHNRAMMVKPNTPATSSL